MILCLLAGTAASFRHNHVSSKLWQLTDLMLSANDKDKHNPGSSNDDESTGRSIASAKPWKNMGEIVTITSPWLTLKGERLLDDADNLLDYWRVEKDDSAVILVLHRGHLVFPKPVWRVGLHATTLDFPGGRVPRGMAPQDVVGRILERELQIDSETAIKTWQALNEDQGWPVNSSFSNQKLFGFVVELHNDVELDYEAVLHPKTYDPNNPSDLELLLQEDLLCLQCRAVLLEWRLQREIE